MPALLWCSGDAIDGVGE
ncbi:hypothetical protein A2U01_0112581, partial [Trifolium medium]|nr:hypothetical protein [Trifolium medium]